MYYKLFLFLNSAKSIYEVYNLCAPMGEVKKRRSRQEQERTHFVAKGPSDPANVSHQCAKRASTASSGKLRIKLND